MRGLSEKLVVALVMCVFSLGGSNCEFLGSRLHYNVSWFVFLNNSHIDPCQGHQHCISKCPHMRAPPDTSLLHEEVTFDPAECMDTTQASLAYVGVDVTTPTAMPDCSEILKPCSTQLDYELDSVEFTLSIILKANVTDGVKRRLLTARGLVVSLSTQQSGTAHLEIQRPQRTTAFTFQLQGYTSLILQVRSLDDSVDVFVNGSRLRDTPIRPSAWSDPYPDPTWSAIRLGRSAAAASGTTPAEDPSFIGSIKQLDLFNRLLNGSKYCSGGQCLQGETERTAETQPHYGGSEKEQRPTQTHGGSEKFKRQYLWNGVADYLHLWEIIDEWQYLHLVLGEYIYPECLCNKNDVTEVGFACADGSDRRGLPPASDDWFFLSPLGVSDGVIEGNLTYGYLPTPKKATVQLSLDLVFEITRIEIYGSVQALEVMDGQNGHYFIVFCACKNDTLTWETVDQKPYKKLVWQPELLPMLTRTVLIKFDGPGNTNRTVHEILLYGRPLISRTTGKCTCFPGNGITPNSTCDKCGQCNCRPGYNVTILNDIMLPDKYCSPFVTSVWPLVGPALGGTQLTIYGGLLHPAGVGPRTTVNLGLGKSTISLNTYSINDSHIISTTPPLSLTKDKNRTETGTVKLSVGMTRVPLHHAFDFTYLPDPAIHSISPLHTFLRGGINITISGEHFNNAFETQMNILEVRNGEEQEYENTEACDVLSPDTMICQTPPVSLDRHRRRSVQAYGNEAGRWKRADLRRYLNSETRTFTLSFDLVGLKNYAKFPDGGGDIFEVYEGPILQEWQPETRVYRTYLDEGIIKIYGQWLMNGCRASDYRVKVGKQFCTKVTIPYDNELHCQPPTRLDDPGRANRHGAAPVRVRVGHVDVVVGYLRYEYSVWDDLLFVGRVAGGGGGAVLLLLVIGLSVCGIRACRRRRETARRRKRQIALEENRSYEGLRNSRVDTQRLVDSLPDTLREQLKDCFIDVSRLQIQHPIGEGNFGKVFKGILDVGTEHETDVALKTLRDGTSSQREMEEFLQEATIMRGFVHDHILTMKGIVLESGQVFVVLPYMCNGDLKSYMASKTFDCGTYLRFCCDVAQGMAYLADHKFVHRDLAARNCMVDANERILVADFGLTRDIYDKDYYRAEDMSRPMPFKWMALEALRGFTFTSKSDVWSFGILMWEVFTGGRRPYADVENRHLRQHLLRGGRLEKPNNCSDDAYSVMTLCWNANPDTRPEFQDLVQMLEALMMFSQGVSTRRNDEDDYVDQTLQRQNSYHQAADVIVSESGPATPGLVLRMEHNARSVPNSYIACPSLRPPDALPEDYLDMVVGVDSVHCGQDALHKGSQFIPGGHPLSTEDINLPPEKSASNDGPGKDYYLQPVKPSACNGSLVAMKNTGDGPAIVAKRDKLKPAENEYYLQPVGQSHHVTRSTGKQNTEEIKHLCANGNAAYIDMSVCRSSHKENPEMVRPQFWVNLPPENQRQAPPHSVRL